MTMHVPSLGLSQIDLPRPYLLFLGDSIEPAYAKTAFGLRDWAPEFCVGEFALPEATVTAGLPQLTPAEAYARGARALVIGVANTGGVIQPNWIAALTEAIEAGLDIISGMHASLATVAPLKAAADAHGRRLIDIRVPPRGIPVATGRKRSGRRLLTVGTDCALGKKYTALSLARALRAGLLGVGVHFLGDGLDGGLYGFHRGLHLVGVASLDGFFQTFVGFFDGGFLVAAGFVAVFFEELFGLIDGVFGLVLDLDGFLGGNALAVAPEKEEKPE